MKEAVRHNGDDKPFNYCLRILLKHRRSAGLIGYSVPRKLGWNDRIIRTNIQNML